MNPSYKGLFEAWEIGVAKNVVDEFCKKCKCLEKEGFDDLLQQSLTHWYFVKDEYRELYGTSKQTFMATVIRHSILNVLEKYNSDKRRLLKEAISLDRLLSDEEDADTLLDTLPADKQFTDTIRLRTELKIELSKVYPKLTLRQKQLCDLLSQSPHSITKISKELGVKRKRVYEDIQRIRIIFESEGLKKYLTRGDSFQKKSVYMY